MYIKSIENRLGNRKSGFLAGTLSLKPSLRLGGKNELSHKALLQKVRGMMKTWERVASRKGIEYKLEMVLSDWSESEQRYSDLHIHFMLYTSACALSGQFFSDWWTANQLGNVSFGRKNPGHIVIMDKWKAKYKKLVLPINTGWLDYLRGNYRNSKHKNRWQVASSKDLATATWEGLGLAEKVDGFSFLTLQQPLEE